MKEYALYKGDEFIVLGTIDEIAEYTGKKKDYVRWMSYPSTRKRAMSKPNQQILIEVE